MQRDRYRDRNGTRTSDRDSNVTRIYERAERFNTSIRADISTKTSGRASASISVTNSTKVKTRTRARTRARVKTRTRARARSRNRARARARKCTDDADGCEGEGR